MIEKDLVTLFHEAIDDFNIQMPKEQQIAKTNDTVLFGEAGLLDSMGLVSFIADIEQRISSRLGIDVSIANEDALSQSVLPFRTVRTLINYVMSLVPQY